MKVVASENSRSEPSWGRAPQSGQPANVEPTTRYEYKSALHSSGGRGVGGRERRGKESLGEREEGGKPSSGRLVEKEGDEELFSREDASLQRECKSPLPPPPSPPLPATAGPLTVAEGYCTVIEAPVLPEYLLFSMCDGLAKSGEAESNLFPFP